MRSLMIFSIIITMAISAVGAEISVGIDRCVILNDQNDNTAESRFAFSFTLPNEISGKEIIYSEIYIPLAMQNRDAGLHYEFILFPFTSTWSENEIDYDNSEAITDSLSVGAYTVTLESTNEFHIDITSFVMNLCLGERNNYGLIGYADLLGDGNIRLSESIGEAMRNAAIVRIVYR